MAIWYLVNGRKVDPNGRPYTGDEPNTPELPQVSSGETLTPGPIEAADEPITPEEPKTAKGTKAPPASGVTL